MVTLKDINMKKFGQNMHLRMTDDFWGQVFIPELGKVCRQLEGVVCSRGHRAEGWVFLRAFSCSMNRPAAPYLASS